MPPNDWKAIALRIREMLVLRDATPGAYLALHGVAVSVTPDPDPDAPEAIHLTAAWDGRVFVEERLAPETPANQAEALFAHLVVVAPVRNMPAVDQRRAQRLADLQKACDALDGLGEPGSKLGDDQTTVEDLVEKAKDVLADRRAENQITSLEMIAQAVDHLLDSGLTLAEIQGEIHEAEDIYNGHYGELTDTALSAAQEQRLQSLPCGFDQIDTLAHGR